MHNRQTVTGRFHVLERLNNSYYGNPRFLVSIDDIVCRTMVDSGEAYGINNHRGAIVTADVGIHYGHRVIENIRGFST